MPNTMNKSPAKILEEMADTFRERNKVYGDNWKVVGAGHDVIISEWCCS